MRITNANCKLSFYPEWAKNYHRLYGFFWSSYFVLALIITWVIKRKSTLSFFPQCLNFIQWECDFFGRWLHRSVTLAVLTSILFGWCLFLRIYSFWHLPHQTNKGLSRAKLFIKEFPSCKNKWLKAKYTVFFRWIDIQSGLIAFSLTKIPDSSYYRADEIFL